MALGWPAELKPAAAGWWLENLSVSGGVALTGTEQRVYFPDQRWRATVDLALRNKAEIFAFRRLVARADGSANAIDLPAFEGLRANWPVDQWGRTLNPRMTRREELDGTIYADPRIPAASAITATVSGAHAIRATSLAINVTQGAPLTHGQFVSIAGRLYILRWPVSTVGTVQTFEIRPPLRAAAASGAVVECAIPTCEMRLASDDQTQIMLEAFRYATLTLSFVEYF